jgi:SMI1 / KNR4 family (SUKH-1)
MTIYERVIASWVADGVQPNLGASEAAISAFEERHSVVLPDGFRNLIGMANGMPDYETDEDLIRFLSLDSIEAESNVSVHSDGQCELIFAEYCYHAHWYILRWGETQRGAPVVCSDGEKNITIADSFDDFANAYLFGREHILRCLG